MKIKTTSAEGTTSAIKARDALISVWHALGEAGAPFLGEPDKLIIEDNYRQCARFLVELFPTQEVLKAEKACIRLVNECVVVNSGLIHPAVKKFRGAAAGRRIDQEELFQEGAIGLQHAVELFEPEKGYAFSTYAGFWVRQAIGRYIDNHGSTIRVPVRTNQESQKAVPGKSRYLQDAHNAIKRVESISAGIHPTGVGAGECFTLEDVLFSDTAPPDVSLARHEDRSTLAGLMEGLSDRELDLLHARYVEELTLEETGKLFGVTRERARQIEAKLLCRLQTRAVVRKKETNVSSY